MKLVRLGDVARFTSGGTPSRSNAELWNGSIPWITGADIADDGSVSPRFLITNSAVTSSATNVIPAGTVLLLTRTSVGKVAVLEQEVAINQDLTAITGAPHLDNGYLVHFLRASKPRLLQNLRGATIKGIAQRDVAELRMPLPALPEQRRIAAILDHVDALRAKRRQVLMHLDSLAQSALIDMFGDPAGWADRWDMTTIGSLARSADYGTSSKAGDRGEWPVLRMGNITDDGHLDLSDLKYLDLSDSELPKYTLEPGDLLFNRTNSKEKVGKAAVVRTDMPLAFAGYLVRVRFTDPATAEFVSAYLRSGHGVAVRRRLAKSAVNQANINASEMRRIPIADPPAEMRSEFCERLRAIDTERRTTLRTAAVDDELFASLQSRAFRGEL